MPTQDSSQSVPSPPPAFATTKVSALSPLTIIHHLSSGRTDEIRCSYCHRTGTLSSFFFLAPRSLTIRSPRLFASFASLASQADIDDLLWCSRCLAVEHKHPYCSRLCQQGDYKYHRPLCVSPTFASPAATLDPDRLLLLRTLDPIPSVYYAWKRQNGEIGLLTFEEQESSRGTKLHRGARALFYRALNHSDPEAIDVLAAVVIPPPMNDIDPPGVQGLKIAGVSFELREQFNKLFRLGEDEFTAARYRGEELIKRKEYKVARVLHGLNEEERYVHLFPLALSVGRSV